MTVPGQKKLPRYYLHKNFAQINGIRRMHQDQENRTKIHAFILRIQSNIPVKFKFVKTQMFSMK